MEFKPDGQRFLWDFWFLNYENPKTLELFYLTAPHDSNPETRHMRANIARATRNEDGTWSDHGIAFSPSKEEDAWDNQATWTGSCLKLKTPLFGYEYIMPYTGVNTTEKAAMQRVGFALSNDTINWVRDSRLPVLQANPKHHRIYNKNWSGETAFRDPYLVQLHDGRYAFYVTTERKDMPEECCGAISVYLSDDLLNWQLQEEPVTKKLPFGQMEVPTLLAWQGKYYLIFSCMKSLIATNDMGIPKLTGAFYLVSDNPLSGFDYGGILIGDDQELPKHYTPKIVIDGEQLLMYAWRGYDESGFGGYLDGPFPVELK